MIYRNFTMGFYYEGYLYTWDFAHGTFTPIVPTPENYPESFDHIPDEATGILFKRGNEE